MSPTFFPVVLAFWPDLVFTLKYFAVNAVAPLPAVPLWSNVKVAFVALRVKAEWAGIENEIVVKSNAAVVISELSLILRFIFTSPPWDLVGDMCV